MKVLIIDDEVSLREVLAEIFTAYSCEVLEAGNGLEGLSLLKENKVDLVVSDYHMPKMSGLDFLRVCKAENIRIPTIWLSGRDSTELRTYAWEFGVFDYLEKPFDRASLKKNLTALEAMSPELKKLFFSDYDSSLFKVPYSMIEGKFEKPTLRAFLEKCAELNQTPEEMIRKFI